MPDEMRDPRYRIGRFCLEVSKGLEIYQALTQPVFSGLQERIFESMTRELNQHQTDFILKSLVEIDIVAKEMQEKYGINT